MANPYKASGRSSFAGVRELLGNGDGTFGAARNFAGGTNPASVAVADFNGDGVPDLVLANSGTSNVSVLLGNGNGTFQPARNFAAGFFPDAVVVGDFNGDGIPDLAVAHFAGNSVSVLLGMGDGRFQAARNFFAGDSLSLAVGDFNGDGRLDLAVARQCRRAAGQRRRQPTGHLYLRRGQFAPRRELPMIRTVLPQKGVAPFKWPRLFTCRGGPPPGRGHDATN
jgi:hypothetical protein